MNKFFKKIALTSLLVSFTAGCANYAPRHLPQPTAVGPATTVNLGSENPDEDIMRISASKAEYVPVDDRIQVTWREVPGFSGGGSFQGQQRLPQRYNCEIVYYNAGSPFGNEPKPCQVATISGNDVIIEVPVKGKWRPLNLAQFKGGFIQGEYIVRGRKIGPFTARYGSRFPGEGFDVIWATNEPISGTRWSDLFED